MSSRRPRRLTASTDRTIPARYEGKLEPNYYCRGWNAKRDKYCRNRAGSGTKHTGVGRCAKHGGVKDGDRRVTTGERSETVTTSLAELIATERARPDPLDLSGELATLRALHASLLAASGDSPDRDASKSLLEAIGRMVERVERIRSQNAISRPELNRIMHEMWRAVDGRITDETIKGAIREDWMRISL